MSKISELLAQIKNLEIQTKDLVEGIQSGAYNSKFRGGGIEFSEVREYVPGDDVKRIDWNVSARHNSLFVKEFRIIFPSFSLIFFLEILLPVFIYGIINSEKLL